MEGYEIARSYLSLWVCGIGLDLTEPTRALGLEPTLAGTRADTPPVGESLWARQFDMSGKSTLGELIDALIAEVRAPAAVWRELAAKAKITLVCSLYPGDWNQGTTLSPGHLEWLAEREIEMCIDVHSWSEPSRRGKPWR